MPRRPSGWALRGRAMDSDVDGHDELLKRMVVLFSGAVSDADAVALASAHARTIAALAQGYVANTALFGPRDAEEYIAGAADVLAD